MLELKRYVLTFDETFDYELYDMFWDGAKPIQMMFNGKCIYSKNSAYKDCIVSSIFIKEQMIKTSDNKEELLEELCILMIDGDV